MRHMQTAARGRAKAIAPLVFWGTVDAGLRASRMRSLLPAPIDLVSPQAMGES
jgi:hypothetical protein